MFQQTMSEESTSFDTQSSNREVKEIEQHAVCENPRTALEAVMELVLSEIHALHEYEGRPSRFSLHSRNSHHISLNY